MIDSSIDFWNRPQLRDEVARLRMAIRRHGNKRTRSKWTAEDLELYSVLPEKDRWSREAKAG